MKSLKTLNYVRNNESIVWDKGVYSLTETKTGSYYRTSNAPNASASYFWSW